MGQIRYQIRSKKKVVGIVGTNDRLQNVIAFLTIFLDRAEVNLLRLHGILLVVFLLYLFMDSSTWSRFVLEGDID